MKANSAIYLTLLSLRFALLALIIATVLTAVQVLVQVWPRQYLFSQHFARYDLERDCVEATAPGYDEFGAASRIEAFFIDRSAGYGCPFYQCVSYVQSANDTLLIPPSMLRIKLERQGNTLTVDGEVLEKGQDYWITNIWHWNPWIVHKSRIQNLGLVTACDAVPIHLRMTLIISRSNHISLAKGFLILVCLIAGFVAVRLTPGWLEKKTISGNLLTDTVPEQSEQRNEVEEYRMLPG